MRPVIAITPEISVMPEYERSHLAIKVNWNYLEAIEAAGGMPLAFPPQAAVTEILELADGWLIPGGLDIDGCQFGETTHAAAEVQRPERYRQESDLFAAIALDFPVLGICYGCQFLNVVRGGTLHQHLPDVLGHNEHAGGRMEEYVVEEGSKLAGILGARVVKGKSYHHQSVHIVAMGLKASARAHDGVVEAIEDPKRPFLLAVQWHPERTPNDPASKALFSAFVREAALYRARKTAR